MVVAKQFDLFRSGDNEDLVLNRDNVSGIEQSGIQSRNKFVEMYAPGDKGKDLRPGASPQ